MTVKKRIFPESNYQSFWYNGKTIRSAIDPSRPITELKYPEFYDVKITGHCEGQCPWCYMDSNNDNDHYDNICQKVRDYFGSMSENERPYQVAIGGGEPTTHPDFINLLKTFSSLGIEPNYTTNGMVINEEIINVSKELCGGVAISCHPHLIDYWEYAARKFISKWIKLNFHIIISDVYSIYYFKKIYEEWKDEIDYFVLLPYTPHGRAISKNIDWEYLVKDLPENTKNIAFGAGFYPYLLDGNHGIKVSLYEPEIMSKFLDLKDMKLYKSSFNLEEVK
jgi:hypothetical protein